MNERLDNSYRMEKRTNSPSVLLPKLFLILTIIFILWIFVVASGSMILGFDSSWAGFSLAFWAIMFSVLIAIFIILDIVFLIKPELGLQTTDNLVQTTEMKIPEYRDGKRVYDFTFPPQVKGGLFSKTYLNIGENFLLRVRDQMFTADELWSDKKESDLEKKEKNDETN